MQDIKSGCYQVIISSPEAYHDANKLRPALLSLALRERFHITVFDEAHCIETWGGSFRKTYARCGDLRSLMLIPENCPVIAATATAAPPTKKFIKTAVQMRKGYLFENLGNFRDNMTHQVFRMTGGQKSYSEIAKLLPATLAKLKQMIIFVHDYRTAHAVGAAVRDFYGLSDEDARNIAPVYHALKAERSKRRIERGFQAGTALVLISTEALTMVSSVSLHLCIRLTSK
jgi:superfamily II DNA helicase RecQ